jgi:hypothetical protein
MIMKANVYEVIQDAFLPFINVFVKEGDEIIIKTSFIKNMHDFSNVLKFKTEVDIESRQACIIANKKRDGEVIVQPEFLEALPNKSMNGKRKKVRVK